ncbi:MAG: nucleotidyl transferase AbiEii/AbiGii toxin family protein [candidate division KSB1 bacterium]|nr:nucleotidyl transferase AbiEii/AbiGii toxin family protein [candidate division KSB1 bacterium]MDZ7336786.1 nucleotidyl transferase AbiEii/AbiGii toxin family protein [candidate division KSB1 bacterium]
MLEMSQIESFYPVPVRAFKKNILREYLQYKILDIMFSSPYANQLAFMGGTAIRMVHGQDRFSEDLDFDNFHLSAQEFEELSHLIQNQLSREGYRVEIRNVIKTAYHCHVNIQRLLYNQSLTGHREEKLVIRIDTEPQDFNYNPDKVIINKFDIFTRINVVPIDLLLAQKLFAILNRKRAMGRDFFDAIFLFSKTKPNFSYLHEKANIKTMQELKSKLLARCETIKFEDLVKDVESFIVNSNDTKRILLFKEYLQKLD